MKVAYLVIAHNQPDLLGLLIRSLACDWAHFFIHVDAKTELTPFKRLFPQSANVVFLEGRNRVKVYWGGFSQVRATLNLLTAAEEFDPAFSRYCLLSGSDFPIKSLAVIKGRFDSDQEFMRVDRRLDRDSDALAHQSRAVRRYFFLDLPLPRQIKLRLLSGWVHRSVYKKIPLYHGAQWWSLTGECVRYLLEFVRENPSYVSFCRYVLAPDEIFFQSIVKQSPFAKCISHDFELAEDLAKFYATNEHGCHYIDWNAPGKVLPKILTAQDLLDLKSSSALFARKFDLVQSHQLLQTLEREMVAGDRSLFASFGAES